MKLHLTGPESPKLKGTIRITGSKSESNRLLLLQAHYGNIRIENLSNSDDTRVMQQALASVESHLDIHHAGTAMRFLTAFFSGKAGRQVILTGSERMKQRPIEILVDALRQLGAKIDYLETPGCPPLKIQGTRLEGSKVTLPADVSSQYISALLLMAPTLPEGLELTLVGQITSLPYIKMTLALLKRLGIQSGMEGNRIRVHAKREIPEQTVVVESDWSSASYYYSIAALAAPGTRIVIQSYWQDSLQGDSVLQEIYRELGVRSDFEDDKLVLTREEIRPVSHLTLDLMGAPDLAQTLAACCYGLGISCELTGLHTLRIKETDRLGALESELTKLGAEVVVSEDSLRLHKSGLLKAGKSIATYNDHRMAMAFAPLALRTDLFIEDAGVVSKSYPGFWKDLASLGFLFEEA
ncbi:MAG: 3-phosphoshikimate 1-carboxyvinyltransferase [Bacteroidetes bacterium]|nr:MAG: 3-phosphoshikimate 1-carboxyvinyltransferase [Bacteroidota bacterium]UCE69735.1 MAG: 3-phosphoshikimate 1-carboxyvinyltransferase [Flavobacteriaceae bacterium]